MRAIITFTVEDEKIKEETKCEAEMRGDTLSQAMAKILECGLPIYKQTVKPKFAPVDSAALTEKAES